MSGRENVGRSTHHLLATECLQPFSREFISRALVGFRFSTLCRNDVEKTQRSRKGKLNRDAISSS